MREHVCLATAVPAAKHHIRARVESRKLNRQFACPHTRECVPFFPSMQDVKDTQRALVRVSYDGRVFKTFRGPRAEERFANEVRVLRYLEKRGCPFVPRLLESDPEKLQIVTTNCGAIVTRIDDERVRELFAELETYGVRHDDAEARNITYRSSDGRFCAIDFEFATILDDTENGPVK